MRRLLRRGFDLLRGQKGISLLQTIVGLAVFATIALALYYGLSAGYQSVGTAQEKVYAESLAKSQVEHIKGQDYVSVTNYNPSDPANRYAIIDIPSHLAAIGYSVDINAPEIVDVSGASGYEIQGITVKVNRHGTTKMTTLFYRTGLAL